jgi:predicted transcriptional regulator
MTKEKKNRARGTSFWERTAKQALAELGRPVPERAGPGPVRIVAMAGEELLALRTIAGVSQATLAGALGVGHEVVSKYESGTLGIRPERAAQIKEALAKLGRPAS